MRTSTIILPAGPPSATYCNVCRKAGVSFKGTSAGGSAPSGFVGWGLLGAVALGGDFPDLRAGTLPITQVTLRILSASASATVSSLIGISCLPNNSVFYSLREGSLYKRTVF